MIAALAACGPPEGSPERPAPPSRFDVVHLVELTGAIEGSTVAADTGLRWSGPELDGWSRADTPEGVTITSPELGLPLAHVERLQLVVTPGGATEVRITPHLALPAAAELYRWENLHRTLPVGLERNQSADRPVALTAELAAATRDNWDDAAGDPEEAKLEQIGILLPGARLADVELREVAILSPGAVYAGAPAGVRSVDRDGLIRPAWYVHGGARVRLPLTLPDGEPELRWHDGSQRGAGPRVVRVWDGTTSVELARSEGDSRWTFAKASLAPFAGRSVVIELATEGRGIGFFGDPRVAQAEAPAARRLVIVYLIDTLRADRIGAWGSAASPGTPVVDRLAREGVIFRNAISSSSWTKPAIPTLMTGVWATTHRVGASSYADRLQASVPLLQERFREAGWRTGSFAASSLGSTLSGLERGFSPALTPRFWRGRTQLGAHPAADQLHAELLAWLDEEPSAPAFAYVHTLEPHEYPRERYEADEPLDRYQAAIHDADARLGELLQALADRKRLEQLLLVVVSDHGHSFGEQNVEGHGTGLFQAQVHIPLIFWCPGRLPALAVEATAGLPDVAPTLLELAGLPALPAADGRSLVPLISGGRLERPFVASALRRYVWYPEAPPQSALVTRDLQKIIESAGQEVRYDLARDPTEQSPLEVAADDPLRRMLAEWSESQRVAAERFVERYGPAEQSELDAEQTQRLRALGYLE